MKYLLDVQPIVVEASSAEEALNKLSWGLTTLARHAGNETDVSSNGWVDVRPAPEDAEVSDLNTVRAAPYASEQPEVSE